MDQRERGELAEIDALVDACASSRTRAAAEDARRIRLFARAWQIAQAQIARIASRDSARRELPLRSIAAQLGAELRMSDRTVQAQLYDAWVLVTRLPATMGLLERGTITRGHAMVLVTHGATLHGAALERFEREVGECASRETVARTRAFAARLSEMLDPAPMQDRHDVRAGERAVWVCDDVDGMSELRALLPSTLAHGIVDRLTRQARAIAAARDSPDEAGGGARDTRTLHQVRADVFADTLLTGAPFIDPLPGDGSGGGLAAIRGQVQVTVPVTTLLGVTPGGAELDGRVPVDPQTARRLAAGASGWDRVLTHPASGAVLAVDRYRPLAEQQRFLAARDVHCRWPGCRTPARHCQIDHNHERRDDGPTDLRNLAHLCVRHHTLKTETAWTVRQRADGSLEFTAPTGRRYRGDPPRRVVFAVDPDPPDAAPPF